MAPLGTRPAALALLAASACSLPRCELDDLSPVDSAASGGDDTAWLAALPVYDCPGPPEGVTVLPVVPLSAYQHFESRDGDLRYQLDLLGVNYGEDCDANTDAVFDGSIPGAALFNLTVRMYGADDPIDLQGEHDPVGDDVGTSVSSFYLLVGWWQEGVGYEYVSHVADIDETDHQVPGFCLSRVRPGRFSGTASLLLQVDPFFDPGVGSFYVTFDLDEATDGICVGSFYEGEATEERVWDDLR